MENYVEARIRHGERLLRLFVEAVTYSDFGSHERTILYCAVCLAVVDDTGRATAPADVGHNEGCFVPQVSAFLGRR